MNGYIYPTHCFFQHLPVADIALEKDDVIGYLRIVESLDINSPDRLLFIYQIFTDMVS